MKKVVCLFILSFVMLCCFACDNKKIMKTLQEKSGAILRFEFGMMKKHQKLKKEI